MTFKEQKRVDLVVGFVNNICEVVCDPDEYLSSNTKDTPNLSIGYYEDNNNETIIEPQEDGGSLKALQETLNCILELVQEHSSVDYSKEWHKLQEN